MFESSVYSQRRNALRQRMGTSKGIVLLPGHLQSPINFAHNLYPFRQDATFSYFFGLNRPGLLGLIELESDVDTLFVEEESDPDAIIWQGQAPSWEHLALASGCQQIKPLRFAQTAVNKATRGERPLHFLAPYRCETTHLLSRLLQRTPEAIAGQVSRVLIHAVVALREVKADIELHEIESALKVTEQMHRLAMRLTRPGVFEREIVAHMRQILGREGLQEAYAPVFSNRGEILHNLTHGNCLASGDLVINDAGANSPLGYASDVTRTLPVGGRFLAHQRPLYDLLLEVQEHAIDMLCPGISYLDVHLGAALKLAEGMKALGFFNGCAEDIVASGAYALCFPHGLGHLLGLDVHDMESLGEHHVGYDAQVSRSPLFGLRNLRLAKVLKRHMTLTVEPGIYFIPALIQRWQAEKHHSGLINYQRFFDYQHAGGLRIEDVVVVEEHGARVLGPLIPKHPNDVENAMA
ncbi:Xaa-Pro aminopeptidase [Pseudomonas endophytica]|uniref:Xaa-Pro aminopeptidase n=1 Tax=Pseudomonas endophytica TaxID=1563157 RepID=A0A0Q0SZZ6_9PSED|nr:aminopeptidase P family protein [Pseudomonas endophytica]KQB52737.1 Xaa-Pro aminopeptidase [Pseudomonas endophytica]